MSAAVPVEFRLNRLPAGIPDGVSVFYIKVKAFLIQRAVVIAVARDSPQSCIAVEAVAAGGVAQQREEVLVSEVVDPGQRSTWCRNDIFASRVIKVTEFHGKAPFPQTFKLISYRLVEFRAKISSKKQVFFAKTDFVISHKKAVLFLCRLLKMKKRLAFLEKSRYFNYRKRLSSFASQIRCLSSVKFLNRFSFLVCRQIQTHLQFQLCKAILRKALFFLVFSL